MAEFQVDYAAPVERTTLSGLSTLPDGHVTAAGERVLAYGPAGVNVGIWVVVSGGPWTRATDFDASTEIVWNAKIYPRFGEHAGAEFYVATTETITPGVTPFTIHQRTYPQIQTPGVGFEKVLNDWRLATTGILPGSYDRATFDAYGRAYAGSAAETATTFMEGLKLVYDGAAALTVEEGGAYVPGAGTIVDLSLDESLTGMVLTANSWYYLSLYSDAREGAVEYSTQRPASPYRGSARVKGGPDNVDPDVSPNDTRRFVGSVRAGATANTMRPFERWPDGTVLWMEDTNNAPYRVIDDGRSATFAPVNCSAVVPPTSRWAFVKILQRTTQILDIDTGNTGTVWTSLNGISTAGERYAVYLWVRLDASGIFQYKFASSPAAGNGIIVDVLGFWEALA